MNKYELRAESVLKKKEEYLKKREARYQKAVTVVAFAACIGIVIGAAVTVKNLVRPVDSGVLSEPTESYFGLTATQAASPENSYNGKTVFIAREEENYGGYMTCYVNSSDEENPYEESNSYGVLGVSGELVVPPVYAKAVAAGENCFIVEKKTDEGNMSALIDAEGSILYDYLRGSILPVYFNEEVHVLIVDTLEGNDFLIDISGKDVLDVDFEDVSYAQTTGWAGYDSDELIKGISNGKYYLINYKGEIVQIFGEEPIVKKSYGDGLNLTAAYRLYVGNYKTLLFGACDDSGREIVPCVFPTLHYTGDRFVGRRGDEQGLSHTDVAVIYDSEGNLVCESGIFHNISIEYGAETGIGVVMGDWDDEAMVSVGGCWVIDKNGNKLSNEYDRIERNPEGTFTAYFDKCTKTHLLDETGAIIG